MSGTAPAREPAPVAVHDVAFPAMLPGFDLPNACGRLNGNRRLHAELLLQFVAEHCDGTTSVARALAAGRPAEAAALLHRMKGAAAIVGARDVAAAAAVAEDAVAHGRMPPLEPLHDAMCSAVAVVHDSVRAAGARPAPTAAGGRRR